MHGVRRALHHRRLRRGPGRARAPLPVVLRRGAPGHRVHGEALDPATLEGAVLAIAGADMLIVGGTSLAVYPAAGLIDYYQGGRLVLMNATPTPYDGRADLIIREPIGRVFAQIQGHV